MNCAVIPDDMVVTGNPQTDTFISDWTLREEYEARLIPNWSLPRWMRWVTHEEPPDRTPEAALPSNGWINQGTASPKVTASRKVSELLGFKKWEVAVYESLDRVTCSMSVHVEDHLKAWNEKTNFVKERLASVTEADRQHLPAALYREGLGHLVEQNCEQSKQPT